MSFESLGLQTELVRAVHEKGYDTPTPIQLQAIPEVLAGKDLMGAAQTGTGKTAGFTLPLLQRLLTTSTPSKRSVRALVLTPTRELAVQIAEVGLGYVVVWHHPSKLYVLVSTTLFSLPTTAFRTNVPSGILPSAMFLSRASWVAMR